MSNGEVCCILGICCPPAEAAAKLSAEFVKLGAPKEYADKCASYVKTTFDLAPAGMLAPLTDYIASHVKK
jgi:hypothetical protein